jgi:hypothetical protein
MRTASAFAAASFSCNGSDRSRLAPPSVSQRSTAYSSSISTSLAVLLPTTTQVKAQNASGGVDAAVLAEPQAHYASGGIHVAI